MPAPSACPAAEFGRVLVLTDHQSCLAGGRRRHEGDLRLPRRRGRPARRCRRRTHAPLMDRQSSGPIPGRPPARPGRGAWPRAAEPAPETARLPAPRRAAPSGRRRRPRSAGAVPPQASHAQAGCCCSVANRSPSLQVVQHGQHLVSTECADERVLEVAVADVEADRGHRLCVGHHEPVGGEGPREEAGLVHVTHSQHLWRFRVAEQDVEVATDVRHATHVDELEPRVRLDETHAPSPATALRRRHSALPAERPREARTPLP